MFKIVEKHPLATILGLALLLRLAAVIFSKGYMASDDHFQTVNVAYIWLRDGFWGPEGYMTWFTDNYRDISRFPLYTVLLYLNMKAAFILGYEDLNSIMYFVRFTHALFSLITVWAVYRTVELASGSTGWAVAAGMIVAVHFAMPFLAVRNLIEMFGGALWAVSLLFLYRYLHDLRSKQLILAGILTGLAWMFRFQMVFAFWIIPVVLLYEHRRLKPPLIYGLSVLAMLLLSGLVDWIMMGTFLGTSINHVRQGLSEGSLYHTSRFIYLGVILAFFIPPVSLAALFVSLRKNFWRRHLMLTVSSLSFILLHTFVGNRQERFMIPIVPALVIVFVLAFRRYYLDDGRLLRMKGTWFAVGGFAVVLNLLLLPVFTLNYGYKGLVEPLVRIEQMSQSTPRVLFFSPHKGKILPYNYAGLEPLPRYYVFSWDHLDNDLPPDSTEAPFDYYLLYPPDDAAHALYRDSIESRVGPIEQVFHVGPSTVDYLKHKLNPRHNPTNEVWVYRNAERK